jgi:hypothetical protein
MGTITSFLKENYDMLSLLVGVLGEIVGVVALICEIKRKKSNNKGKQSNG